MVQSVGPKESYQMSDLASLAGSSLNNSISLKRSYGATRADSNHTDTRVLVHEIVVGDTLQGLAIRYGVTVEKIKRLNKLWSNESLFLRETVKIPYVTKQNDWQDQSDEDETFDKDFTKKNHISPDRKPKEGISQSKLSPNLMKKDTSTIDEKMINCNDFLSNIDDRINKCKDNWAKKQCQHAQNSHVPCVSYDSKDSYKLSPTKQNHTFLEKL